MPTLYGAANTRAFRCLWMLEEIGREYTHVPTDIIRGAKAPEYMKLNPNGRVPCLVDGDLVLFESLAINMYLARVYGSPLWPGPAEGEARMFQWTLWATNEIDAPLSVLIQDRRLPKEQRGGAAVDAAMAALPAPLRVLDAALAGREYLLDNGFSLADLNVASVLAGAFSAGYDLSSYVHIGAWMQRCIARPAAQKAIALATAAPAISPA